MAAITMSALVRSIGVVAPPTKAAGWDPVGLQIGDPAATVESVAVCHEVTATVLEAILEAGVDAVVSYHPLLFRPTNRLVAGSGATGRAFALATAGVSLLVVHTAFDVAKGGAADSLAAALDLEDVTGFGPLWGADAAKVVVFVPEADAEAVAAAMSSAGAGVIGNYSGCSYRLEGTGTFLAEPGASPVVGTVGALTEAEEVRLEMVCPHSRLEDVVAALVAAHPYEEPAFDVYPQRGNAGMVGRVGRLQEPESLEALTERVHAAVGGVLRIAGVGPDAVRRVAVVPGSGADFLEQASGLADAIVTGDVGHHRARRAVELGLAVIDPGHGPTERPGLRTLYAAVSAAVDSTVDLTGIDDSPWKE